MGEVHDDKLMIFSWAQYSSFRSSNPVVCIEFLATNPPFTQFIDTGHTASARSVMN
jgi:hypothetical protein